MSNSENSHSDSEVKCPTIVQKFNLDWLKNPIYNFAKRIKKKDQNGVSSKDDKGQQLYDDTKFYCSYCKKSIVCEKFNRHYSQTMKHIKETPIDLRSDEQNSFLANCQLSGKKKALGDLKNQQPSVSSALKVVQKGHNVKMQIKFKLAMFLIQNHLPFIFIEELLQLLRDLRNTKQLIPASNLKVDRKEMASLSKEGISAYYKQNIIQSTRSQPFGMILDEAKDSTGKKYLLVMIRTLNVENMMFEEQVHSLIQMKEESTGQAIYDLLKENILNDQETKHYLTGICTDGASNMRSTGKLSMFSLLSKENPSVWSFHDVAHCLHLTCKYTLKHLPINIMQFLLKISSKFSRSSQIRAAYKTFQEKNKLVQHEILRLIPTRWGSAEMFVERLLEQWEGLKAFMSQALIDSLEIDLEDEQLDIESDEEETGEEILEPINNRELFIFAWDEKNNVKQYLQFLHVLLEAINYRNKLFQGEQIMVLDVSDQLKGLIGTLCRFILKKDSSDYSLQTLKQIFFERVGGKARQKISKWYDKEQFKSNEEFLNYLKTRYGDILDLKKIAKASEWAHNCMRIVFESLFRLFNYIPFFDPVLVSLKCLNFEDQTIESWQYFAKRFSHVVSNKDPKFIREVESFITDKEIDKIFKINQLNVLKTWKAIREKGQYQTICKLTFFLLVLPISSVSVERAFKDLKLIKNSKRNRLVTESIESLLLTKKKEGLHEDLENIIQFYENKENNKPEMLRQKTRDAKDEIQMNEQENDKVFVFF